MAIVKSKHASNFTVLPNSVFNSDLSVEAIGLLAYFLSLPHDWVIYKTQLHDKLGLGREKLDRIFKELQTKGFVLSVKKHGELGRIEYEHVVYDLPFNNEPQSIEPSPIKPCAIKPSTAKTPLLSTDLTKETNTKETLTKGNLIDVYFNDLENSQHLETIARLNNLSVEYLRKRIPDFKKKVDVSYTNFDRFANHFKNFVLLNPIKINTAKELK